MTNENDGWGKPMGSWGTPVPQPVPAKPDDGWMMLHHDDGTVAGGFKPETVFADSPWPTGGGFKPEYVEGPDAWPVTPVTTLDDTRELPEDAAFRSARESVWPVVDKGPIDDGWNAAEDSYAPYEDAERSYGDTDEERARAANSCINLPASTEWFVDVPDGELTLKDDYIPTVTKNEETGFYVAYSQGILHAVLAGPYERVDGAKAMFPTIWHDHFVKDASMSIAFERRNWNPAGLYVAEIPLKARRKGAYGRI